MGSWGLSIDKGFRGGVGFQGSILIKLGAYFQGLNLSSVTAFFLFYHSLSPLP